MACAHTSINVPRNTCLPVGCAKLCGLSGDHVACMVRHVSAKCGWWWCAGRHGVSSTPHTPKAQGPNGPPKQGAEASVNTHLAMVAALMRVPTVSTEWGWCAARRSTRQQGPPSAGSPDFRSLARSASENGTSRGSRESLRTWTFLVPTIGLDLPVKNVRITAQQEAEGRQRREGRARVRRC